MKYNIGDEAAVLPFHLRRQPDFSIGNDVLRAGRMG